MTAEKVDQIMDEVDNFYRVGDRDGLNDRLISLDLKTLSVDEVVTYLSSTLRAYSDIPYRAEFFEKSKKELMERGECDEEMFRRLEGTPENQRRELEAIHVINQAIGSGRVRSAKIE